MDVYELDRNAIEMLKVAMMELSGRMLITCCDRDKIEKIIAKTTKRAEVNWLNGEEN